MRRASSFENERVALPAALGDRHAVTMETAGPHFDTGITELGGGKKVANSTVNIQTSHSVSVMCLKWNCLSGRAPLEPIIGLRPGLG